MYIKFDRADRPSPNVENDFDRAVGLFGTSGLKCWPAIQDKADGVI